MTRIDQGSAGFIALAFFTLASCATGVDPSADHGASAGTGGGSGSSGASGGVGATGGGGTAGGAGGTAGTGGSGAAGGVGGSSGTGGTSSGGAGGSGGGGGSGGTGGTGGTGGSGGAGGGTGGSGGTGGGTGGTGGSTTSDAGGDIRDCNPGKTADCPTPINTCETTAGCVDIIVCLMQNSCARITPCSSCDSLVQGQSQAARTAADNLLACLGGCT